MVADRHARLCKICKHEQKDEIDLMYTSWYPLEEIVKKYPAITESNLRRHAKATGLNILKQNNYEKFLFRVMDKSGEAKKANFSDGVNAVKLKAQLDGKLIDRKEVKNTIEGDLDIELKGLKLGEIGNLLKDIRSLITEIKGGKGE